MERLFSSPHVRRGGRTGGASGLLDRGHPVSRALGQGSPRPEHAHLLAGAVACGGALWARCWDHPGRPGALGYDPFSRPPRRNRRSGLVPGHPSLESHPRSERCWLMSVSPRLVTGAPWASLPGSAQCLTTGQGLGGSPSPLCSPHS